LFETQLTSSALVKMRSISKTPNSNKNNKRLIIKHKQRFGSWNTIFLQGLSF